MKKLLWLLVILCLAGCSGEDRQLDRAMNLRQRLLSETVSFRVQVTAHTTDTAQTFSMSCQENGQGEMVFTVNAPESISGITGRISDDGGKLTFDGAVLGFSLLADGEVSPVSAPWLLMKTLRSGYLKSCAQEEALLRLTVDDSYEEDALQLDIWLDGSDAPVKGEILWQGRRILYLTVSDFHFL